MKAVFITVILAIQFAAGCSDKVLIAPSPDVNDTTRPIREIPDGYRARASQEGNVVRINYRPNSYHASNTSIEKHAYVYLPYNYDADRTYNIFYLLHGSGGNAERYFK